ncbi:hypothetical protein D9613_001205 [Agrocybe pediades]|uniref:Uncharacterized protein n=1 Tax=Agrocybe pediades TaxID=84607 RepID=A0A8H4R036_9AGAR|nr:hypothetical protein D9613_001205 [Agrocybe pediades]
MHGCVRDAEVSADGSHFRTKAKEDPRERQIDEVFLARNYRQDSNGRFHTQPTPTASMLVLPRQLSDESSKSKVSSKAKGKQRDPGVEGLPPDSLSADEAPSPLVQKENST